MGDNKRVQITVVANDSQAQDALDGLLEKLERINALCELDIGAKGGVSAGEGAGGRAGGAAAVGQHTTSTAGGGGDGGGGGDAGGPGLKESMWYRAPTTVGSMAANAAGVVAGMGSGGPGAGFHALGNVLTGAVDTMTGAAAKLAENMPELKSAVPGLGAVLSAVSGATKLAAMGAATWLKFVGEGMNIRTQKIADLAGIERPAEIARMSGFGDVRNLSGAPLSEAKEWGYGAQEGAQMAASYARARGSRSGGQFNSIYALATAGISPEMVARIASLGTAGGGGMIEEGGTGVRLAQTAALKMVGTARRSGLAGGKVDEYLGRIAAFTGQDVPGRGRYDRQPPGRYVGRPGSLKAPRRSHERH